MSTDESGMPALYYPSGHPMPQYGPTTDDELIIDGLEWAYEVLRARDVMNAAVHCKPVRYSPVTVGARTALALFRGRLVAPVAAAYWDANFPGEVPF